MKGRQAREGIRVKTIPIYAKVSFICDAECHGRAFTVNFLVCTVFATNRRARLCPVLQPRLHSLNCSTSKDGPVGEISDSTRYATPSSPARVTSVCPHFRETFDRQPQSNGTREGFGWPVAPSLLPVRSSVCSLFMLSRVPANSCADIPVTPL